MMKKRHKIRKRHPDDRIHADSTELPARLPGRFSKRLLIGIAIDFLGLLRGLPEE